MSAGAMTTMTVGILSASRGQRSTTAMSLTPIVYGNWQKSRASNPRAKLAIKGYRATSGQLRASESSESPGKLTLASMMAP